MDLSLHGLKQDCNDAIDWVGNHEKSVIAGVGVVGVGAAIVLSRGEVLAGEGGIASRFLPKFGLTAATEGEAVTSEALNGVRSSLRQQTFSEKATEKIVKFTTQTAKSAIESIKGPEEVAAVNDDTRRHVINRFLSRLDQEKYVLHGSYSLEGQSYITRAAVKDVDLLSLDKGLMKPTRAATNEALIEDLRGMAGKDTGDGLRFEIPKLDKSPVHAIWPRMRHATAIAMQGDQEVMRFSLDLRLGANTILPATEATLKGATGEAATTFKAMQPEENAAFKMFTYTTRSAGGIERKARDLGDVASMIRTGLDEDKVTEAMSAFVKKGYTPGALRHPADIMGSLLERKPELMAGQTPAQLDENFHLVRNFYEKIAPRVFSTPVNPEVSTGWLSRLVRFGQKQLTIYPAG
jgi:hypothetical protein